jgi:hypothetical protein
MIERSNMRAMPEFPPSAGLPPPRRSGALARREGGWTRIQFAADWLSQRMRAKQFESAPTIRPVLDQGGGGPDACERAFNRCRQYAEQLYDKGYDKESNQLLRGCPDSWNDCDANEQRIHSSPDVAGVRMTLLTLFPPNKAQNGGGYVVHRKGSRPLYVPPSIDPITPLPPGPKGRR